MQTLILIITAFSVSVDSFFCGLSLAIKSTNYKRIILGVILSVFCLCYLGANLGYHASEVLKKTSEMVGGLTLMLLAILDNLPKKESSNFLMQSKKDDILIKSVFVGFSIGLDGAVGCFSLTLMGLNAVLVTIVITFVHILLLITAFSLSKIIKINNKSLLEKIPSYIIFLLGAYKFL